MMTLTYRLAHPCTPTSAGASVLAVVSVQAPAFPLQRRPLHLGIALDRSGSMRGAPLAAAKTALNRFLQQLVAADRFTLVAFDSNVDLVADALPASEKWAAEAAVASLRSGGMTNLSGGWLAAADAIARARENGRNSRLVLLTDGHANVGLTQPEEFARIATGLRAQGIVTSTVGIGARYDDAILRQIAAHSGGNEHHIDDAEGLAPVLAAEFDELVGLYAQNVTLRFSPGPHVTARVLSGYPVSAGEGTSFSVALGDIVASDERSVLIEFTCGPCAGTQQLTVVSLSYQQVAGEVAFRESVAFLDVSRTDVSEPVPMDPIVLRHLTIVNTAEAQRRASDLAVSGDIHEAFNLLVATAEAAESAGLVCEASALRSEAAALQKDANMSAQRMRTRASSLSRHHRQPS
jgi:Ca-activated chloride channel family protein